MTKGRSSAEQIKEMVVEALLCKRELVVKENTFLKKHIIITREDVEYGMSYFDIAGKLGFYLRGSPDVIMTRDAKVGDVYVNPRRGKLGVYQFSTMLEEMIGAEESFAKKRMAPDVVFGFSKDLDVRVEVNEVEMLMRF